MGRRTATIAGDWFEDLYRQDADPWHFATSDYERAKYADTLDALPRPRFAAALEIGCANGVFTALLAPRCDGLLALDPSETALAQARTRCAGLPVRFQRAHIPDEWPSGRHDLLVFSEVLYYLDAADLCRTAALATDALAPGGVAILVHYLGETDYPLTGDEAANQFIAQSGLYAAESRRRPRYRLDVLQAR